MKEQGSQTDARDAQSVAAKQSAEADDVLEQANKSSNMVSVLVIMSRLTGFLRTAAQAWAIGVTMFASCYTIADTLPNMLYEFVVGGMLATSFLPVYIKVRDQQGTQKASDYASNILSIVTILMGALTLLSFIFAYQVIWTQSAGATESFDSDMAVWLFRWFSCEIVFYALSSLFSGILNAERDYLWSNAAPILNNIIIISAFALFGALTRAGVLSARQAMIVLAIGNPLGVAAQALVQFPVLRKRGVHIRAHVNLHDPALRETLSIGLPTLIVVFAVYLMFSVSSSFSLSVTASGAAITYYARVWYALPFSVFAVPIALTMFTELSNYFVQGEHMLFCKSLVRGASTTLFSIIPFTFYFVVFATYLVKIIAGGSFSTEDIQLTATFLSCVGLVLPFYALYNYLGKVCSAMIRMKAYAAATILAAVIQLAFCALFTSVMGLSAVAFSQVAFYATVDICVLISLWSHIGTSGLRHMLTSVLWGCVFGFLGALVGWAVLRALEFALGPAQGTIRSVIYTALAGIPALVGTYGVAYALGKSQAPFFDSIFGRVCRMLHVNKVPRRHD